MHLKSITLKGFKSFPDRTKLDFGPGVSVIVGPNGSGKSNVTDAVLWAMGEQSPLAVRGQSMQDVIFGGGRGQTSRQAAEVEIVIDNGDGGLPVGFSEIAIVRRLDRTGEGEYRLNGARCRLVDVIEMLSDTGLGKEGHSIVSQGRVEAVVTSKPKDRRLLIEEAAGLGKHRKRRRRAQLKLERTQENLDRALDVEREARSRLRPLKRQAEAAELHARLERQTDEARWSLARDAVRARRAELAAAEGEAAAAHAAQAEVEAELRRVAAAREAAEEALAGRSEAREALAQRAYAARTAADRVGMRLESVRSVQAGVRRRSEALAAEVERLAAAVDADAQAGDEGAGERIAALESELERLEAERADSLEREVAALEQQREAAAVAVAETDAGLAKRRAAVGEADAAAEAARAQRGTAERAVEAARREAATVGAELAAVNQFLRTAAPPSGAATLAADLQVDPGYELAVAAVLGPRLGATVVDSFESAVEALANSGDEGGSVLVDGIGEARPSRRHDLDPLERHAHGSAAARHLLAGAWVVDDIATLPAGFDGVAVTRTGTVWFAQWGELRQVPTGGDDHVLAERNRRDELIAATERAAGAERDARTAAERAGAAVTQADAARDDAERAAREAQRARDQAAEAERRIAWLVQQRREAPDEGPGAVRRAQVQGELAAERRVAEQAARERALRAQRLEQARGAQARDAALGPQADRLAAALEAAAAALAERVAALDAELSADREAGQKLAAGLRAHAASEAQVNARLKECGGAVTAAAVRAQQVRDAAADAQHELDTVTEKLGLEPAPAEELLADEEREALEQRIARLQRRREQLGPVNPLAQDEYAEALAHVEELEAQRTDLEAALRELQALIADTDREIRERFEATFAAAARNFEEVVDHLFPGGKGHLRLVADDAGPRPVLGDAEQPPAAEPEEPGAEPEEPEEEPLLGVEIELTPSGKSTKRLSLLSGGEKSLTALAFLFSVFLARPCPFYILDEVEAALDDLNIDRFLALLRRYAERAQFIVVTHQKRTMEAADVLYGVSMGDDGVSKVVSRKLPKAA
ncbi:MAG TPA: AAA family ATPase [Solirubrobacteraceae bacterium]|nr:AAA family ATPase [Solirubrobacteraceae bacterium]